VTADGASEMAGVDKLLARLRNNPRNVTFDDLDRALNGAGYELVRVTGSHHIYRRTDRRGVPITVRRPSHGPVAPGAVRDVLACLDAGADAHRAES